MRFRDTVTENTNRKPCTEYIEQYHIQWPWVTSDLDFATFLDIEYLTNDTRQSRSYYRTSIGRHRLSIEWRYFQWPSPVFKIHLWSSTSQKPCVMRTKLLWNNNKQKAQLMLTNLRDAFRGQSRSPNIVSFHMLGIVSYCAIVTLSLSFTILDFKKCRDLEIGSKVTQGHWEWYQSIDCVWFAISVL